MSKRRRHTGKTVSAKALVFDPLFRSRQETAKKGKGSYNRRPRNQPQDSGPFSWATFDAAARPMEGLLTAGAFPVGAASAA
ncbi:MAG: alternative ribosome rescue factor ArfA, partial [Moraxellaceae bacterium]|nr:alternative ribosome rescue factor ArfA [Moraxellaceae bacterium]